MATVSETRIPGLGIRFEFEAKDGTHVGVLHRTGGRHDLVIYERDDPDSPAASVSLDEDDSRTLGELLGTPQVSEELARLQQRIEGLAIDWLTLPKGGPFGSGTIGDTQARTRTGVSIVAVVRGDEPIPAPGPAQELTEGDTLVVVGTPRGIERLAEILRTG
jgi:TrkA domain protein